MSRDEGPKGPVEPAAVDDLVEEPVRVDLSPLDPRRDPARLTSLAASVAARAMARRRQRRVSVPEQLRSWARPALAMAASLAVLVWAGATLTPRDTATAARESGGSSEPAWQLSSWAQGGELPEAGRILEALGGDHVGR